MLCINELLCEEAYGLSLGLGLTAWGHLCPIALSREETLLHQVSKDQDPPRRNVFTSKTQAALRTSWPSSYLGVGQHEGV